MPADYVLFCRAPHLGQYLVAALVGKAQFGHCLDGLAAIVSFSLGVIFFRPHFGQNFEASFSLAPQNAQTGSAAGLTSSACTGTGVFPVSCFFMEGSVTKNPRGRISLPRRSSKDSSHSYSVAHPSSGLRFL
jgi:hypothetical protein